MPLEALVKFENELSKKIKDCYTTRTIIRFNIVKKQYAKILGLESEELLDKAKAEDCQKQIDQLLAKSAEIKVRQNMNLAKYHP